MKRDQSRHRAKSVPTKSDLPHDTTGSTAPVGAVRADEVYTLAEFMRRLAFTSATLRSARRAGLPVYYANKRGFVLGRDWINYVLKSSGHQEGAGRRGHA
jgi:hypothetical protein